MPVDPSLTPAHIRRHGLRCLTCGRSERRSADELRQLARTRWPECCGEPMPLAADPAPPEEAPSATPIPERRAARRRLAKSGARVEVRRGPLGMGPNLAVGLVELSQTGARVRLKTAIQPGVEVEVALWPPAGVRSVRGPAEVRWCRPVRDGTFLAGLRLRRTITNGDLRHLADDQSPA
jgi:PilZ domain